MAGDEGFLTLTVRVRVSPEPEVIGLLKRYRSALNFSIEWIVKNSVKQGRKYRVPSISTIHKNLYEVLKRAFNLPSRIVIDCYREALAIAKSYLGNGARGRIPRVKTLRMWLTPRYGYRIKGDHVEIIGGYKLKIIGWDRRYDNYEDRETRLAYRGGKMFLMITKRVPKPKPVEPRGVVAVDMNERAIYVGNGSFIEKIETVIDRALHFKKLAEELERKYSFGKYRPWLARRRILERIKHFHRRAKNITEDWARKTALRIVRIAKQNGCALAREDLNGLIESLRALPKEHRVKMITLSYRVLINWIDWQAQKHGVKVIVVDPRGTSSTCPTCGSRLVENGYRIMKCPKCGLTRNRDEIAVLNITKKALFQMGRALTPPTAPQMKDVAPNRWGEPMNRP